MNNYDSFTAINKYRIISDICYGLSFGVGASGGTIIENHICPDNVINNSTLKGRIELHSDKFISNVPIVAPPHTEWMTFQTRNIIADTGSKTAGVGTLTTGAIYLQYE